VKNTDEEEVVEKRKRRIGNRGRKKK